MNNESLLSLQVLGEILMSAGFLRVKITIRKGVPIAFYEVCDYTAYIT